MSNEIMLQKIENTCQSTRTSDLSFERNSYTVYSHRDFFLAPLQTYFSSKTDYNISAPRKAF